MKNFIPTVILMVTTIASGTASANNHPLLLKNSIKERPMVIDENPIVNVKNIDWDRLDQLVTNDPKMTPSFKTSFKMTQDIYDPVERDRAMRHAPYYDYLKTILYPKAIYTF